MVFTRLSGRWGGEGWLYLTGFLCFAWILCISLINVWNVRVNCKEWMDLLNLWDWRVKGSYGFCYIIEKSFFDEVESSIVAPGNSPIFVEYLKNWNKKILEDNVSWKTGAQRGAQIPNLEIRSLTYTDLQFLSSTDHSKC